MSNTVVHGCLGVLGLLVCTLQSTGLSWQELAANTISMTGAFGACPASRRRSCTGPIDLFAVSTSNGAVVSSKEICSMLSQGASWWQTRIVHRIGDGSAWGKLVVESDSQGQQCSSNAAEQHACPGYELASMVFKITLNQWISSQHSDLRNSYIEVDAKATGL